MACTQCVGRQGDPVKQVGAVTASMDETEHRTEGSGIFSGGERGRVF